MTRREFPFWVRSLNDVLKEYPDFQPGWKRGKGNQVLFNPNYGEIRHLVVCDSETGRPIHDQPAHIEPVGGITIPVTKAGKIRLQKQPRAIPLSEGSKASFPETIEESRWGRWFLDVPRGFPIRGEDPQQAAIRETTEESRSPILKIVKLGEVNANATFFVHMIPVFLARIDEDFEGELPQDCNERVFKGDDYTLDEVKDLVAQGKIQDALSLAALNLFFQKNR